MAGWGGSEVAVTFSSIIIPFAHPPPTKHNPQPLTPPDIAITLTRFVDLLEFPKAFQFSSSRIELTYRAFDSRPPVHPSVRPPATIFPEFIDELKQCRQASGTPQIAYFMKADDVSYPNSNTETSTKTNTETNTKTETNKGRT